MLDFHDIHKYRENNRIEAKKAQGGLPHSLWETYSAFANSFGGVILLGVIECEDKSFATVPLQNPEGLVDDFWCRLCNGQSVSANILKENDVSIVESGENRIVVIEVPRADSRIRPVYLGNDPYSGSYRRSGEGDYRCTREEVDAMLSDRADSSWDLAVIHNATAKALDLSSVGRYRLCLEEAGATELSQLSDRELLKKIGAAVGRHPTAAGLLMFGKYDWIIQSFPSYSLEYSEPGFFLRSGVGEWSGNLFDFYLRVLERLHARVSGKSVVAEALREALANSIIHASYFYGNGVAIENLSDSIVISNPGTFHTDLKSSTHKGTATPRNMTLISMFSLINIGRNSGSALSKIQNIWHAEKLGTPEITEQLSPERVSLRLPLHKTNLREQSILEYLTVYPDASTADISEYICRSSSRTRAILKGLMQRGLITDIGKGKKRRYRLKS